MFNPKSDFSGTLCYQLPEKQPRRVNMSLFTAGCKFVSQPPRLRVVHLHEINNDVHHSNLLLHRMRASKENVFSYSM